MPVYTLLPTADVTAGTWTTAPLFSKLTATDGTFISAAANTSATLAMGSDNYTSISQIVFTFVVRKSAAAGNQRGFTATVLTAAGGSTNIALGADNLTETYQTFTHQFGAGVVPTSSGGFQIQLNATGTTSGSGSVRRDVQVDFVRMVVTGDLQTAPPATSFYTGSMLPFFF